MKPLTLKQRFEELKLTNKFVGAFITLKEAEDMNERVWSFFESSLKEMVEENELLWEAYDDLLELRGHLVDIGGKYRPNDERLLKYMKKQPKWEKELDELVKSN